MSSLVDDFNIFIHYVVDEIYTDHPMCLDALLPVFCSILYSENTDMVRVYNIIYTKSLHVYNCVHTNILNECFVTNN